MHVVELRDVHKSFGSVQATRGVSLAVERGGVLALLGPNGAGKTTLLRMIVGMLRPDRGTITYGLNGVASEAPEPRLLGYLPEERGLYADVPIMRTLVYFAMLRGMDRAAARAAAQHWLDRLELGERANDEMRTLSKGNQQKVQFVASILHRPTLAVLDEPFSGLDPLNQDMFLELIRELRASGATVILSAHQMQLVERIADRVVLIREGEAVEQGTLAELRVRWGADLALHDIYVRTVGARPEAPPAEQAAS